MSGETERDPSAFTIDSLRIHLEQVIDERDRRYEQRFSAQEKAVNVANTANEKRFDCVSADTPILCADLVWRPAGDLLPGDELVACDEVAPSRRGRRYRRATVTHNALARDALLLVTTTAGSIRCNSKHPWLARPGHQATEGWRWIKAEDLRPGDIVSRPLDVWDVDRSWASGWLAGMYDGEGCLTLDVNKRSQLSLTQRESPTSDLIEAELKGRVDFVCVHRTEASRTGDVRGVRRMHPMLHFIVTRLPSVLTLLGSVRPPRLLAKADGAWESKPLGGWHRTEVVTSVEPAGTGTIANLSTSTATYIAGGYAMHNSVNEFRGQLADRERLLMPRGETEALLKALADNHATQHSALAETLDGLAARLDRKEGQQFGSGQVIAWGFAAVAALAAVIGTVVVLANVLTAK